jgi:hypothetical protein
MDVCQLGHGVVCLTDGEEMFFYVAPNTWSDCQPVGELRSGQALHCAACPFVAQHSDVLPRPFVVYFFLEILVEVAQSWRHIYTTLMHHDMGPSGLDAAGAPCPVGQALCPTARMTWLYSTRKHMDPKTLHAMRQTRRANEPQPNSIGTRTGQQTADVNKGPSKASSDPWQGARQACAPSQPRSQVGSAGPRR